MTTIKPNTIYKDNYLVHNEYNPIITKSNVPIYSGEKKNPKEQIGIISLMGFVS